MKLFFLKETGLYNKFTTRTVLSILSLIPTYFLYNFVENSGMILAFFAASYLSIRGFFQMSHVALFFIRCAFPYEIKDIKEGSKNYKVHIFPVAGKTVFFHKGKKHRDKKPAVIYHNPELQNEWYQNGVKIQPQDMNKNMMKNNIEGFFLGV